MRLIDADALIKELEEEVKAFNEEASELGHMPVLKNNIRGRADGIRDALIEIVNAPTVEPNIWIPCSERLPEEWRDVLLSFDKSITEWTNVGYMFRDEETFEYWFQSDGMSYKKDDVLAWMPLPDAYEVDE